MKIILLAIIMAALALADIGEVTVVKGDAFVKRDVKEIKAFQPMPLLQEDIVETKEGRIQMHFIDDTVISMGKESRFIIKEYFYEENSEKVAAVFEVEKGFIKTITGAIGKMFAMKTASTTVQPHGTVWSMMVAEGTEDYRVIEGSISLAFDDGEARKVLLKAGESMHLEINANNRTKVTKATKKSLATTNYEHSLELNAANITENRKLDMAVNMIDDGPAPANKPDDGDDGNNGGGDDPGGEDPSDPDDGDDGNTGGGDDPGGEDPSNPGGGDDGNNGGGNDLGGVDPSNPGGGHGHH